MAQPHGGFKGFQVIYRGALCGRLQRILVTGSGKHDACFLLRVEGTQVNLASSGRDVDIRLPFLPALGDSLEP